MARRPTLVDQVRDGLTEMIVTGVYQVGDRLPNEQDMCERFEVSRATVREAYRALIDAGYLSRQHGTGTFVTRIPNRHSLDLNLSYTSMIQEAGFVPSVVVVRQVRRPAGEEDAALLQIRPEDEVYEVERVRYANQRPVVYSLDRVPVDIVPPERVDDIGLSIFEFLESVRRGARNGRARITATLATERESQHLQVPIGVPLLHFDETDYDISGSPVLASKEWHTSDVFELWLNRRAQNHKHDSTRYGAPNSSATSA
jgi:GntR family transcriptional regulator